jgi:hypothetical protein
VWSSSSVSLFDIAHLNSAASEKAMSELVGDSVAIYILLGCEISYLSHLSGIYIDRPV